MYDETELTSNDLLAEFVEYLKSAEAQTIIADEGYVSVVENAPAYTVPEGNLTVTEIEASGSTSVGPLMTKLAAGFSAKVEEATGQEVQVTVSGGGSGQGIKDANEGNQRKRYDLSTLRRRHRGHRQHGEPCDGHLA